MKFFFKSLFFFWYRFFFKPLKNFRRSNSSSYITTTIATAQSSFNKYRRFSSSSLLHRSDLSEHTLLFDVEGALLRSSSVFPYFMLVAFEAGGLIRAIVLVLTYPFVCLVGEDLGMKIMVMVCFLGIKEKSFRVGRAVLPKFMLEDVGSEIFEVVNGAGKRVGLSKMPRVMVESFLEEYLKVDFVVGREIKVFCGYFLGFMEEREKVDEHALELLQEGKGSSSPSNVIAISGFRNKDFLHRDIFSRCKEVYLVGDGERKRWQKLSRDKYPKPLIFHDGRLALSPTFFDSLAILTWLPFAVVLAILRIATALTLPFSISTPLLTLTGLRLDSTLPSEESAATKSKVNGNLYVCNHRTLLDPLYISFLLRKKVVAVTYSLSRMSEILAPIKTVRLTRKREEDARMMKELLMEGDLVVCPEGTTCREPYLLRFSPLFSELCEEISPVAIDSHVSMFHGTTAGGLKCMDPLFFLMNPFPYYSLHLLHNVTTTTASSSDDDDNSRFVAANQVQSQIGEALGFQCTKLTRKDKYLILAGNEGIVSGNSKK
ncbi:hypothetical protein PIB30_012843 [Stylosanthes scabra]|uniref:Phospholipid/glycerol acyltransferase domain-containing protein n=1 Tax=Stylosanthes scabra TaxID=79078 RepID=A0ABU6V5B3_9FABA|nr:hypothetical protein [Stylosanthes scabra]